MITNERTSRREQHREEGSPMESTNVMTEQTYVWPALSAARVPAPTSMGMSRDKCALFAGHGAFGFRGLIVDTDPIRSSPPPG